MANHGEIPVWRNIGTTPLDPSRLGAEAAEQCEILIIGGGPVGLTLALDLGLKGRKVILLNRLDFVAAGSKAICFAKRTLDIWDRLGVAETMIEKGVIWNVGKVFYDDDKIPLYCFDILPVKGQKNPGFINIQQYHVEDILIEAINKLDNVDLRWGHEAVGLDTRRDGVSVAVHSSADEHADEQYAIEAKWVAACDGSRSPTRDRLGLDFEGRVFEDNFLIADVKFKQQRPSERCFWFDPPFHRGQSALLHKQPDDIWRLDFQLGWDIDREACIRPENVEPLVRAMIGDDIEFTREWYSIYTFQCRRMENFVHGRVIFAGDSAHLVSPFGARGCNGGVADADNLAWKLDAVLEDAASSSLPSSLPSALIDSYNYEAIVTADENILNSTRSTDFMTPKSEASKALRDAVLELAKEHEFARSFVNSGRLSTAVSYPGSPLNSSDKEQWIGGISPGHAAMDAPLAEGWLLEHLGGRFVLLTNDPSASSNPVSGIEELSGRLGFDVVNLAFLSATGGLAEQRYALEQGGIYLIRPDQYIAARWKSATVEDIARGLERAQGISS